MINVKLMMCGGSTAPSGCTRDRGRPRAAVHPSVPWGKAVSGARQAPSDDRAEGARGVRMIGPLFIRQRSGGGLPVDPATLVTRLPSGAGLG
jgi:hypothetical protein